ncbi:MAG: hypothetical protein LBH13_09915 [Cellulomonadaceae bacterium]|nr:hypothetical protein [Cellulomonadaceae bacterium]
MDSTQSSPIRSVDVYRVIRESGTLTLSEITKALGTEDVPAIERAIEELSHLEMIRPSLSEPDAYRAPAPSTAFQWALGNMTSHLREYSALLSELSEFTESSPSDASSGDLLITELRGSDHVVSHIAEVVPRAHSRVDSLIAVVPNEHVLTSAFAEETKDTHQPALSRFIYPEAARDQPHVVAYATAAQAYGCVTRTHAFTPARILITDHHEAVIADHGIGADQRGLAIRVPLIVDVLAAFFEDLWNRSRPLLASDESGRTLKPREVDIVRAIAAAQTDAAIARKLGVGPRTVGRIVAGLKRETGVKTRQQLLIAAERNGWLE